MWGSPAHDRRALERSVPVSNEGLGAQRHLDAWLRSSLLKLGDALEGRRASDAPPHPYRFRILHASSDVAVMQFRHCAFGSQPRWAASTP